jgi:hypothetical protein
MPLLPDRLMPREMFGQNEGLVSANRRFSCRLGTDGILRIFNIRSQRPRSTIWSSSAVPFTAVLATMRENGQLALEGSGPDQEVLLPPNLPPAPRDTRYSTAVLRDNGVLQIVDQDGVPFWQSPPPSLNVGPNGAGDFLEPGEQLTADSSLFSQSGVFELAYQSDGNLVLYRHNPGADRSVLWASGTAGREADRCVMCVDGVLRLYDRDEQMYWDHILRLGRRAAGSRLKLYNSGLLRVESPNRHVMWRAQVRMSAIPRADSIAIVSSPSVIVERQASVEVGVILHRLSDNNGRNAVRVTPAEMETWIAETNVVLAPANVRFRFDPATDVRDVRNTRLNRLNPGARSRDDVYAIADAEIISRARPEVLHVIARSSRPSDGTGGACGVGCGFSWWTMNEVFMPHFDPAAPWLLAHEFGHHLGLPHTMAVVIDTLNDARLLFRFANPPDRVFDGDAGFVDDTPPDLFIGSEANGPNNQLSLNGRVFQYLRNNIMSYYPAAPMQQKTITVSQAIRLREILFRRSQRGVRLTPA